MPKQCARVESHPVTQSRELEWNEGLLSKKKASATGKGCKARRGRQFPFLAQPPWSQGCLIRYLVVMPSWEVTYRQANGLAWTLISWGTEKGFREEPETWKSREKNESGNKTGSWLRILSFPITIYIYFQLCSLPELLLFGEPIASQGASQVVLVVNTHTHTNPPANAGDTRDAVSIPGSGRSPRAGNGYLLQYSCLENPMDRGAWWAHKELDKTELTEHACTHGILNGFNKENRPGPCF